MSEPSTALATQITTVRKWLEDHQGELAKALPQGMDASRFARIALTAVLRQPKLASCDKASFILSLMESAALGLEPDSVSGLAYLIPFGTTCQLIVGYRGMIQLAYRSPRIIEIGTETVHELDTFSLKLGFASRPIDHSRPVNGPRGKVTGAYAGAKVSGGGRPFVYLSVDEIEEHRARSRAKDSGPWVSDYQAMAKKTAIRQLCKFIPQSPGLMQALAVDADPELEPGPGNPPVPPGTTVDQILDGIAGEGA